MVGATGFEPATLCSQSRCATGLRHAPTEQETDRGAGSESFGRGSTKVKPPAEDVNKSAGTNAPRQRRQPPESLEAATSAAGDSTLAGHTA